MLSPRSALASRSRSLCCLRATTEILLTASLFTWTATAWAQDDAESASAAPDEEPGADADALAADGEAQTSEEVNDDAPAPEKTSSPPDSEGRGSGIYEDPETTYLFAGVRYRLQMVPQAVQNWFAEGGETLWVHTPGVEFAVRQDRFEYNIFAMLGMYSMTDVPFKGNSDVELAWETITADYNVLFLGTDLMWSTKDFTPGLAFTYGAGIGLGIVFGEMTRTQAYPDGSGSYAPCTGVGNPNLQYCDNINNHYDGYVEPSWADGGSSPLVFPWIAGQVGLRYKAHRNFVGRLEAGITVTSVFFGLGADYGL